jgi:F0F1-type ATP synthase assembly protein I
VGELQAKLAELRNQMSQISSDATMANKIDQLNKEKSTLEKQLADMQIDALDNTNNVSMQSNINKISWRNILISICITIIIGMAIGAYLLDLASRRRHGGFRI